MISQAGRASPLYLRQEGAASVVHKLMAYQLQDQGKDTVEASSPSAKPDQRDLASAQILVELGVKKIRLLTNSHRKFVGLEAGLEIVGRLPIEIPPPTPIALPEDQGESSANPTERLG